MNPDVLTAMLEGCWAFAKLMLSKAGDFYPFGETADAAGVCGMQGGYNGEEHPDPRAIYELLQEALTRDATAGKISAVALAANVDIPVGYDAPYRDAIRVHLETVEYSRVVYLPYRIEPRSWFGSVLRRPHRVSYAEPFTVEVPAAVFTRGGRTRG
jgi:hypothetical protein